MADSPPLDISLDTSDYCFCALATDPLSLSLFPANLSASDAEVATLETSVTVLREEVDRKEKENQETYSQNTQIIRRLTEARDTIVGALSRLYKYDQRFPTPLTPSPLRSSSSDSLDGFGGSP
jgi:hypothetical protein